VPLQVHRVVQNSKDFKDAGVLIAGRPEQDQMPSPTSIASYVEGMQSAADLVARLGSGSRRTIDQRRKGVGDRLRVDPGLLLPELL
jgi:hypothetical protein